MDGTLVWEHYEEEFIGWEKEVTVIGEVREGCLIEDVYSRWKEEVLAASEKGIGRYDGEVGRYT